MWSSTGRPCLTAKSRRRSRGCGRGISGKVDTLAFEFLVLTAARGAEVRGVVWSEIDQDEATWTIPASRMKTGREHRVPLCGRALEILEAARKLGDGESSIVFVNERGRPLDGRHDCSKLP